MSRSLRQRWEEHYASGHTPWDTQQTPPEVKTFWVEGRLAPVGLALDVGCGPGTNVTYLARQGLVAIGFDIAPQAVQVGRARIEANEPGLVERACLVQADVTQLPIQHASACYILDLGCSHGLPLDLRARFAAGIVANLRPGGYYHLYGFDYVARPEFEGEDRHMGFQPDEIVARFSPALEIVSVVRAMPDPYPCQWYIFRKPEA